MLTQPLDEARVASIVMDGHQVRYWVYHPDKPQVIVFLHGFRGNHHGLIQVAQQLSSYQVVIPDLPGYGQSETMDGPHDFTHYADWLQRFTAQVGIKRYILAGHSYGATLAIVTAATFPQNVDKLVLIAPVISASTFTSHLGQLYYRIGSWLPGWWRRQWIANSWLNRLTTFMLTTTKDPAIRRRIAIDEQANIPYIIPDVEIESFLGFYHLDLTTLADRLTVPTLYLIGQHDQMTPLPRSQQLAHQIRNVDFRLLPAAGHFVPMEDPSSISTAIAEWLSP